MINVIAVLVLLSFLLIYGGYVCLEIIRAFKDTRRFIKAYRKKLKHIRLLTEIILECKEEVNACRQYAKENNLTIVRKFK